MNANAGADSYGFTLLALQASLSSYTSKPEREQCDRYIQDLKQREECMSIMSRILAEDESTCNQYIKLLSLSILNDWIKMWWNKLPEHGKVAVKQLALDLLSSNLAIHENASIRTKIAVILSNVVERVFPQYWPGFVKEMIDLWVSSPFARQDVILKALETVIVDSVDADFNSALPTLRRQEIVAGIVEMQVPLFETSYQYLGYCFQEYCRLSAGGDRSATKAVLDALLSQLAMLSALTALVKVEDFCAAPHNFALLLVGMCNTPQVQIKAMDLLHVLAYLSMSVELFSVVLQALSQLNVTVLPEEVEDSLHFQRTYAGVLHNLLSQHVQYVLDSNSTYYLLPDAARTLTAYIARMLTVVEQSPSVRLSGDIIKDWVKIYREKSVNQCPAFQEVAMTVLNLFMQKCRKPLWTEYPANTSHALNATGARVRIRTEAYEEAFSLEFEDTEEWATEYYGTFKSQFRLLSQTICEKFCVLSAQTLSQYLGTLVQSECASAGAAADCVEAKTLLLDLDILHYVYSPLLQTLIVADPAQKKTSNEGGKEDSNPVSEADRKAVLTITLATLGNVLQWKPRTASLQMEPYKILQYHYPLLKLSVDHLGAAFSVLFDALSASIAASASAPGPKSPVRSAAQVAADASLEQSTKISACVASLTQHCAQEIVHTGFFQEFFRQVGSILTQVPYTAVQNNMRQALMALSDHIADPALRVQTLGLAVEDVLRKWTSEGAALFVSSDALLEALLAQVVSNCPNYTQSAGVPDNRFETMKRSIDTFLLAAKRITYPPVPMDVWTKNASISLDEFTKIFPFAPAWLQCLPVAFQGINVLHSVWSLQTRKSFEDILAAQAQGVGGQLPGAQVELLNAICLPDVGDIGKFAGMRLSVTTSAVALTPKFAFELKELRIFLYQLLAQAAAHKSLYYAPGVDAFMSELTAHLPLMENAHLVLLMRNFVEQYVLNALPMFFPQVSTFLAGFFSTTLQRLSTAWDRSSSLQPGASLPAEQRFYWQVYRMCSVPEGFSGLSQGINTITNSDGEVFNGFSREEIENARDHLIGEVTKAYADVIAAFLGLRGFLFTAHASAATAAAAEFSQISPKAGAGNEKHKPAQKPGNNTSIIIAGKGKDKTVRKRVSFDNADTETSIFDTPSGAKEPLSDEQQLELGKHARRESLFALLVSPSFGAVTQPFVSSVVTLICLPDASACKFAIQMAQKLLDHSISDARFIVPVAKDAFSAALSVLLQQEKWSIGLEWDLIEYVLDVYLMLVVGEGRHPVNVGAGSGHPGSTATTSAQGGNGGGMLGGNGALVPVHHHTARSDWPQQLLLTLNGVTREKLAEFDVNLQKMLSKKKRRGLMKDLITEVITWNKGAAGAGGEGGGSVFSANVPSVLDVRHRLMKSNSARKQANAAAEVDLSRLFG